MAKKQKGSLLGIVFLCLVLVGLVLVVVGMFVGQVTHTYMKLTTETKEAIKLFDGDFWNKESSLGFGQITPSNTLGIIAFIVAAVGLLVLICTGVLQNLLKKDGSILNIVRIVGVALTIVGAVLILVSGITMANACYGDYKEQAEALKISFAPGIGVWLGFVGGLVGGVCGALPLLKPFK
ncbi:MAG: hypothetical protein J1F39_06500 [Clostridiales bacterium]|nr:hypothetical protein [Clostridiales bacterium]